MSDVLVRIKRAILAGRYVFSEKARLEMEADGLTELRRGRVHAQCSSDLQEDSPGVRFANGPENIFTSFRPRTWMDW